MWRRGFSSSNFSSSLVIEHDFQRARLNIFSADSAVCDTFSTLLGEHFGTKQGGPLE